MEKIFIASDHAAFEQKEQLKEAFKDMCEFIDLGTDSEESVHYPLFGQMIAKKVLEENARGIALCGSGIGISIQVNRFKGVRGALCRDVEDAKMSRLHNNSNILCIGGRRNSISEIKDIVKTWLATEFEGGRHQTRIEMMDK
ncbi:MAG: ribose 5-phosphate isomerase B [Halobacteriovoraceae bacterium]|nr:ribose 5-phosphate isomerase B [Halobacteriovoraceae bacterium]|tara:strand:+ start:11574 stop:11999 length:426 start_codon:yes stop_codon:yes gene_type:complete